MSAWIYKQTEFPPDGALWTVGHGDGDTWFPESDHGSPDEAAARVRWLNGGGSVGVCGARMHDSHPRFGHRLYVCTKTPGHVQGGDVDHYDGVAKAPAGTWREPVE